MPKDTKTLGNNKARACESLGFVHKKRLCQRFDTTSSCYLNPTYLLEAQLNSKVYNTLIHISITSCIGLNFRVLLIFIITGKSQ